MSLFRTLAISLLIFGIAEVYAKESVDKPSGKRSTVATENVPKPSKPTKPSKPSKPSKLGGVQPRSSTIHERWTNPPAGYTTRPGFTLPPSPSRRNIPVIIRAETRTLRPPDERQRPPVPAREPPAGPAAADRDRQQRRERPARQERQQERRDYPQRGGTRDRSRSPQRH